MASFKVIVIVTCIVSVCSDLQLEYENEFCDAEVIRMNTALPFIVLQPTTKNKNSIDVWCDAVIFSESWGIAPPNCFSSNNNSINKYYLTFVEEGTHRNVTYLAILKTFVPPKHSKVGDYYCDNIGLFQIRNFQFIFKNVITLPKSHMKRDLSELIPDCRIVGAVLGVNITIKAVTFSLANTGDYCHVKRGECSPLKCMNYNFNVTYIKLNVPKARPGDDCKFDPGYQWGASLMCVDSSGKWTYMGMANDESMPSCALNDGKLSYQGFTRVDAYLEWIVSVIIDNGGYDHLEN